MQQKTNKKSKKVLLDSSAVIALLKKEPGFEILENIIATSSISTVNFSEIISVLVRSEVDQQDIDDIMNDLVPDILPFTQDIATVAGKLIIESSKYGLSFGDRACLATAIIHNMQVYTADKAWSKLDISCEIILIR